MAIGSLQQIIRKTTLVHFLYLAAFALSLVAFGAWNLMTPEALRGHWFALGLATIAVSLVWFLMKYSPTPKTYRRLVALLIGADIALATFTVYAQRGTSSQAIALYAIPIIVASLFGSRFAIYLTTCLSIAGYVAASLLYAAVYPREIFKIEVYGMLGFYSTVLWLVAVLLWTLNKRPD